MNPLPSESTATTVPPQPLRGSTRGACWLVCLACTIGCSDQPEGEQAGAGGNGAGTASGAAPNGGGPASGGGTTSSSGGSAPTSGGGSAPTGGTPVHTGGADSADGGAPASGGGDTLGGGSGGLATGGEGTGGEGTGGEMGWEGPWPPSETFSNPVLWQDIADPDVIRVGDAYYYTGSNMHHSPGAPILRSYDLVQWEFAGHAIPSLDFGADYRLEGGQRAYIGGDWASTLGFRESEQKFYFLACIRTGQTYVWKADQVEGPWERGPSVGNCYYDAGMLIDDDDTIYVAYGHGDLSVAELNADATGQVRAEQVFSTPSNIGTLEGSRMYRVGPYYYIWATRPANGQYVLRSTDPFGPYEVREFLLDLPGPVQGAGVPHQGGLVETQNGDWYYMAFVDAFPGARMPVLAPITWQDDWPVLVQVDGSWGQEYPYPDVPRPPRLMASHTGKDEFNTETLDHAWEWNHEPDNTKWSTGSGLTLHTASVTDDLYQARNTLTRRILGPSSHATIELDHSGMQDGDVAGLSVFRHTAAYIGIQKSSGAARLVMVNNASLNVSEWTTNSIGTEVASQEISGDKIWLRASADITPGPNRQAHFSYSTDGVNFMPFGDPHTMSNDWQFFIGYRYAILNFATTSLGGSIRIESFEIDLDD